MHQDMQATRSSHTAAFFSLLIRLCLDPCELYVAATAILTQQRRSQVVVRRSQVAVRSVLYQDAEYLL